MIFKQIEQVIGGTKTQTRRHFSQNSAMEVRGYGDMVSIVKPSLYTQDMGVIRAVGNINGGKFRTQYRVGKNYAIQPGRGKRGIPTHRIKIDRIRCERLQDIAADDVMPEGISHTFHTSKTEPAIGEYHPYWYFVNDTYAGRNNPEVGTALISSYRRLWESINTKAPLRWQDNPLIPVYDFRVYETDAIVQELSA